MTNTGQIEPTVVEAPATHSVGRPDLILFDGVCNLCNGWVRFVIERDSAGAFQFAPLQSEIATEVVPEDAVPPDSDSIVLIHNGHVYTRSGAVLRIARKLRWPWPLLSAFLIVPAFIRNLVYDLVAQNRYQWFGRRDECMIPTPELRSRFLS